LDGAATARALIALAPRGESGRSLG